MAVIAELGRTIGKSMPYEFVPGLRVGKGGLPEDDRICMWVEGAEHQNPVFDSKTPAIPGQALTLRNDLQLASIRPEVQSDGITLSAPGLEDLLIPTVEDVADNRIPVKIWSWHGEAIDQGDEAAKWGEAIFKRPVRFVRISSEAPRYVENNRALGRVAFSDGYPLTIGSLKGIELINQRLESYGQAQIPPEQSRTTLLLEGLDPPYELPEYAFPEDYIASLVFEQDDLELEFEVQKACGRCLIMNQQRQTGENIKGRKVLYALGQLGRQGRHIDIDRFGDGIEKFWTQNASIRLPKNMPPDFVFKLVRNAEVRVNYRPTPNWVPLSIRTAA